MEGELFQGGVLMHSYLRAVGFSRITKRSSIRQIITDVVETYDEKTVIENYPDGMFAEFSKNYGCDCGITVCGLLIWEALLLGRELMQMKVI